MDPRQPLDIDELLATLRHNEAIVRKLFDIESRILGTTSFRDLFEKLLAEIETQFAIPHVWLSIVHAETITGLISDLRESPQARQHLVVVDEHSFRRLAGDGDAPSLVNDNLERYAPLVPPAFRGSLGSMAIAPIRLDGRIIGSFNQGDRNAARFSPDKDTFFLRQLAVKVSICLANVTAHEQLRVLATRDPLTHLPNRRELETILAREFQRARRQDLPLSVVFIDCDDFKQVNDTWGHDAGDAYLNHVARELSSAIRASDCAFRFAGDEFVLVLPGQTEDEARRMGLRLRERLAGSPLLYGEAQVAVRVSLGAACSREAGVDDSEGLLRLADARLYEDKRDKPARRGRPTTRPGGNRSGGWPILTPLL
jgi:diguanylate cyclase (GGDEF)-like protein